MIPRDPDPMLRRFERNALVACVAMAAVAAVVGRFDIALGIVCGGLLMGGSYVAIKGGVDAMLAGVAARKASGGAQMTAKRRAALLARFVGRYALLALAAYVMLACLHTHPVGLLVGAASPVVAVAVEAVRFVRQSPGPGRSR